MIPKVPNSSSQQNLRQDRPQSDVKSNDNSIYVQQEQINSFSTLAAGTQKQQAKAAANEDGVTKQMVDTLRTGSQKSVLTYSTV